MSDQNHKGTKRTSKDASSLPSPVPGSEGFIPPHGGYQDLLSYQKALVVYDATLRFCDRFIDRRSRTHDQMVQAARSGKQNILEGRNFLTEGGLRERMTRARLAARAQQQRGGHPNP